MTAVAAPSPAPSTIAGVTFGAVSLTVDDPNLTFDDFEKLLVGAGQVATSAKFWIGDLLNYGESRYGERYSQAIEITGLTYGTLTNYASVCRRIKSPRRREELRFTHHDAAASLDPEAQIEWLGKAVEQGWTAMQFRDALRDAALIARASAGSRHVQTVLDPPDTVDAARNLSTVRDTLGMVATGASSPAELAERIPASLRALDEAGATVRRAAEKLEAPSLLDAVRRVLEAAVKQTGLADPAYIVPAKAFDELIARWAETEGEA